MMTSLFLMLVAALTPVGPCCAPLPGGPCCAPLAGACASAPQDDVEEPDENAEFPRDWKPITEFRGVAVETVREVDPKTKRLVRIACIRRGVLGEEIRHGPEWTYWRNGQPQRRRLWVNDRAEGIFESWQVSGLRNHVGEYKDGRKYGIWRAYKNEGELRSEQSFLAGRPHGEFKTFLPDGRLRKSSHWEAGLQVGTSKEWNTSGVLILIENYERGELHGPYIENSPTDGSPLVTGNNVRGEKDGVWRSFDKQTHLLESEVTYRAGVFHGPWTRYHQNQKLRRQGNYERGQRFGPWKTWYANGQMRRSSHFRAELEHGLESKWREDGSQISAIEYVDGVQHGHLVAWFADGSKQMEGEMVAGKREGYWTYWRSAGTIHEEWTGTYRDDKRVDPGESPEKR